MKEDCIFKYGAVTLFGRPFQTVLLTLSYPSFRIRPASKLSSPTDHLFLWSCNPALSFRIARFRLFRFRSPLLSESRLFSLPPGTEMVHFPGFAPYRLCIHDTVTSVHTGLGSPIRKSPDHRLLASPRGLSQLATSFFAYLRQGIHTHALSSLTIKFTPIHRVSLFVTASDHFACPYLRTANRSANLPHCQSAYLLLHDDVIATM